MRLELEQRSIADQESALDDTDALCAYCVRQGISTESETDTGIGPLKLFSAADPHGKPKSIRWPAGIGGLIAGSVINAVIERLIAVIWGS